MSIWKYSDKFIIQVPKELQLTLNEGDTPCFNKTEYADSIGLKNLFIKNEGENPTGSHKDRSLVFQISAHLSEGQDQFVISSSGNAAISAVSLCKSAGISLHVFISPKTPRTKVDRLNTFLGDGTESKISELNEGQDYSFGTITMHIRSRAKSCAFQFAKENGIVNLRGSTDPFALEGFKTIAFELFDQAHGADSVFIPCSSGTSAAGLVSGYNQIKASLPESDDWKIPQLHIVQTSRVHPIAEEFDENFRESQSSIGTAIVDRVAHRKQEVIHHIIDTDGFGWIVDDSQIKHGLEILKSFGIETSPEGGMAMAAILRAKHLGWSFNSPVCLLTGKQ